LDWSALWVSARRNHGKPPGRAERHRPITQFDTNGFDCKFAGEIKNLIPSVDREKRIEKDGPLYQVALAGADFAVKSANWKPEDPTR